MKIYQIRNTVTGDLYVGSETRHNTRKRIPEVSAATRQVLSERAKGRKVSDETRRKHSSRMLGNTLAAKVPCSPEKRAAISAKLKGRIFTPEHRAKIAATKAQRSITINVT